GDASPFLVSLLGAERADLAPGGDVPGVDVASGADRDGLAVAGQEGQGDGPLRVRPGGPQRPCRQRPGGQRRARLLLVAGTLERLGRLEVEVGCPEKFVLLP